MYKSREGNIISKKIWITWENQRRNYTLSKALGAKLFQFDLQINPIARYLVSALKTLVTFKKERPTLIFVQNPSLVLAFLATNYGLLFKIPVVVDTHYAGIFPLKGHKWWTDKVVLYVLKRSSLAIVTNYNFKKHVEKMGGRSFVLPDPLPVFSHSIDRLVLKGKHNVLFICTFAEDEPYIEVIKAAKLLREDIYVYISGNPKDKKDELRSIMPENVILTGYIPEEEFLRMLYSVDVIIDLTTREDCLVCGAYEAVAAEKPLIVSDTIALREYFYEGVLYTNNTCEDLAEKIMDSIDNKDKLEQRIRKLKRELLDSWEGEKAAIGKVLQEVECIS